MKNYITKQRKRLLFFLKENPDKQFTVEDIAAFLKNENISISSIYRNINKMAAEGSVQRFPLEGSCKFLYQYIGGDTCSEHIHMKCEKCGRVFHLDDDAMDRIFAAVVKNSDFCIDKRKTVLYGQCHSCNL